MTNPFDYFDKILCINLDRRTDRWDESVKEFEKIGIKDKVERFSAIENSDPAIGCNLSHYECIKIAKKEGSENVLIFEDDVKFINETIPILKEAIEELDKLDWYMFYLGANTHHKLPKVSKFLSLLKNSFALHACAYHSEIFDYIIEEYDKVIKNYRNPVVDSQQMYDVWVSRNIQNKYMSLVCTPIVATQRSSYSDLQKRVVDYGFIEKRSLDHLNHKIYNDYKKTKKI